MASKAVFKTIEAAYAKEPKNIVTSLKLWYIKKVTGRMARLGAWSLALLVPGCRR